MRKSALGRKALTVLVSATMVVSMMPTAALADAVGVNDATTEQSQVENDEPGGGGSEKVADADSADSGASEGANNEQAATEQGQTTQTGNDSQQGAESQEPAAAEIAEVNGIKYPTLQAAIDAAPERATVKLLANTKENVTISKKATLDLNGYTLNGSTGERKPALTVTSWVYVKDSSEAQTGTIMREDTKENSGDSSHYVIDVQGGKSCWLFFQGGNVKNDSGAGGTKGASLVRVGDDKQPGFPHMTITGGTFTQENFIALKCDYGQLNVLGGTINSANSYAIQNWKSTIIRDAKDGTSSPVINGNVSTWTYKGSGSSLEIDGGTVTGKVESVTYDGAAGKPAKVAITGGTVEGRLYTLGYNSSTGTSTEINDPAKATIEVSGGTFSADPSRYLVESSSATQNADGTYGVAKAYLAKVGETSYYTMEDAINAQTTSGNAITLLRDYTTGSVFASGNKANRVVDLNGYTWTCTGAGASFAAFQINYPNSSITVQNGKVVSSLPIGLITSAKNDYTGEITPYDNSSLTFDGVEASTTATSGIETNGNNTNDTVVLKNSTLNVSNGFGIYFPSSGTLTIDNSTINAKTMGVQVCSGSLNVNAGSKITVSGDPVDKAEDDGAIQDGAAISIVNRSGYKGLGKVDIAGGTFTAKGDYEALKAYTWNSSTKQESAFDNSTKTVAVSGGTFSSAVSAGLCAEGCTPVANADGTYGVASGVAYVAGKGFDTLQAAIDAAQDGETIQLLADATEDVTVAAGKNIALDLGGKMLTNTNANPKQATLSIAQGATATVKNGSVIGGTSFYTIQNNGTATLEDVTATAGNTDSSMIDNWGTLTIENGSYAGGLNVVKSEEDSTLTINGGKFELSYAVSNKYNGVILAYGNTTITGGEFVCNATGPYRAHPQCVATGVVDGYTSFTKITGGTFTNNFSDVAGSNIFRGIGKATSANFEVTGGTFSKKVSDGYFADGYTCVKNSDGTYGIATAIAQVGSTRYTSLQAAINAMKKGKTVQLLNDATENITVAATKQITLDLNGHTLNGGTGTAKAAILNKGTVTITDTSADKTGTIKRDDQGIEGETSYYVIRNIGTMVIDQANVVNNSGYKKTNPSGTMVGSSLICNGDDDPQASLTINGGTFTQLNFLVVKNGGNGTLTVNGGTLTSEHSVVQNWNKAQILGGKLEGGYLWTDSYAGAGTIGETVIGGSAQFTGTIYMDVWDSNSSPSTLKIEGGKLDVTKWTVTSAAAKVNSTVDVSGGTFTKEVPAEYCADGFAPAKTTDASGNVTYGVASGLVNFWGGSLRMDKYENADGTFNTDEADLRFGFNFDLPAGAKRTAFGFDWGISKSSLERHVDGVNVRDAKTQRLDTDPEGVSGTISNLVVTNIPKDNFGTVIYAQMWVTYELNGVSYTIHTDVQSRSVSEIATKIMDAGKTDSKEYKYASALLG